MRGWGGGGWVRDGGGEDMSGCDEMPESGSHSGRRYIVQQVRLKNNNNALHSYTMQMTTNSVVPCHETTHSKRYSSLSVPSMFPLTVQTLLSQDKMTSNTTPIKPPDASHPIMHAPQTAPSAKPIHEPLPPTKNASVMRCRKRNAEIKTPLLPGGIVYDG